MRAKMNFREKRYTESIFKNVRFNGVVQILLGWKEIPVHDKHQNYHEYRKRLD